MVNTCLVACLAAGVCISLPCNVRPPAPPPLPDWATREWVHDAAGIVAGETVPDCAECDLWIACTIVGDVEERGYHPWRLRPAEAGRLGRWYGWRGPRARHVAVIKDALRGKCESAPTCAYLGSLSDYAENWRFGLAQERPALIIGNRFGAIVCVH